MSLRFLASRLAQGLLVLWIAFTLSFFLLYRLPGRSGHHDARCRRRAALNFDPAR